MDLHAALSDAIERLASRQPRVAVAIDGPDAAGKTTLADALAPQVVPPVIRVSIDDFDNVLEERRRGDNRSGESYYRNAFDHTTFRERCLAPFMAGAPVVLATFRHQHTGEPNEHTVEVPERAVLLVDGVFLQRPELRDLWSFVAYLTVAPELTLERARVRDLAWNDSVEVINERYAVRYLPGQALYRAEVDPEATADLLVDNSDPAHPIVLRQSSRW